MNNINAQIEKAAAEGAYELQEFLAGVKFGMQLSADVVQRHQCEETRTGDCTCIHDGDAAAKVIKKKMGELE